jgi:OOP family OmpA-OmpF porin
MRLSYLLPVIGAFLGAALLAVLAASIAVAVIERQSLRSIEARLLLEGHEWAEVSVDGLLVRLTGTAPDEATRFQAVSSASKVVDSTRVLDEIRVGPGEELAPPRFSIEILRNASDISLIGLAPQAMDRSAVLTAIAGIAEGSEIADLLETVDYPAPSGWNDALDLGLEALGLLRQTKISVSPGRVAVRALTADTDEQARVLDRLNAVAPAGLELDLDIAAPRPVVTPFTLRFVIDEQGPRFDACTAHTEEGRAQILAAAADAGLEGEQRCRLGLGVPSPRWPLAASASIRALSRLGQGSVTLSDADITLVAGRGTTTADFDRVIGELRATLPDVFALDAVLPEPDQEDDAAQVAEFLATRSPEGLVQLRGRIPDARLQNAVVGFARARFAGADVYPAILLDENLPIGWPKRVLAGLEALSYLDHGSVRVQPENVTIRGSTGNPDANDEIARILSDELGGAARFEIDVTYVEALDPVAALPSPEECVERINAILESRKITFAPGSAEIDTAARETIDRIAEAMKECEEVAMEIGGHTDSQGREEMNERLSQNRADAVLSALLARRVLTSNLTARGYGESEPIADNDTEEGREANRRIEFRLLPEGEATDTPEPEEDTAGDGETPEDGEAVAGEPSAESEEDSD